MKRSIKLAVIFGGIALLIAIFFILTARDPGKGVSETDAAPVETIRITDLEEGSIARIEINRADGGLELVRENGAWSLVPEPGFSLIPSALDDIAWNLRTLSAERVVDDSNLTAYGLSAPRASINAVLSDGSPLILHLGDQTPSKQAFYVKKEGDSRIFTIRNYKAEPFFFTVNDLRPNRLTHIDKEKISYIYINTDRELEIIPLDREQIKFAAPFAAFMMTKPWRSPRATDAEKMQGFLDSIPFAFQIQEFVAEKAPDLGLYGLDTPSAEVVLMDHENTLHIFIGDRDGKGNYYVTEKGNENVVSVEEASLSFLNISPFRIMDKFALIVDIGFVDRFVLTSGGKKIAGEIVRDAVSEYRINGNSVEEKKFKQIYQKMIGLLLEAEHPSPHKRERGAETVAKIAYDLNLSEKEAAVSFFEYNRDFYAVETDGGIEFLISRGQVDKTIESAIELASQR